MRQEDYLAIEAAVMETARGRWFLSEYARRNRNADTDTLLNAIDKLEKTLIKEQAPASVMDRIKLDLSNMAAAIEKTKQEIAQIKHEDNDGSERFERASSELDAIVEQTETATGDILGAAEKIQEYAWTLREKGGGETECDALDTEATNIYMACSFQDLTGQRIKKIVDAMRYVERRINAMIDIWGFESETIEIDQDDARSLDARPDNHLLNGPALAGEGIEQDHIDTLLDDEPESQEANQDDVDALFDDIDASASDALVDGFEAESAEDTPEAPVIAADDEFDAVAVDAGTDVPEDSEASSLVQDADDAWQALNELPDELIDMSAEVDANARPAPAADASVDVAASADDLNEGMDLDFVDIDDLDWDDGSAKDAVAIDAEAKDDLADAATMSVSEQVEASEVSSEEAGLSSEETALSGAMPDKQQSIEPDIFASAASDDESTSEGGFALELDEEAKAKADIFESCLPEDDTDFGAVEAAMHEQVDKDDTEDALELRDRVADFS